MILFSFMAWFGLGYLGGRLFAKKGYHPNAGVLIGILLGPMVLALCLFLPKTASGRRQAALEAELADEVSIASQTKSCPDCNRSVGVNSRFCPRCTYRFETSGTLPSRTEKVRPE